MARVFNLRLESPLSKLRNRGEMLSALGAAGCVISSQGKRIPWVTVFCDNPQGLAGIPGVTMVEEDTGCDNCMPIGAGQQVTDPWHLRAMRADVAHQASRGAGSRIAIIDTGILPHPELERARISTRETFVPTESPDDYNGHGLSTHGLIAGGGPIIWGIAPEAEIHSLKALNAKGQGRWSWISLAVERAAELRCDVAVMALGGSDGSHMLEDALELFTQGGGIPVAAAGNDGNAWLDYPGASAHVITVAAIDRNGRRPKWSSWERWPKGPDVAAPGVDVPTLGMRGYKRLSGTSIATALAGGAIALAKMPGGLNQARQRVHAAAGRIDGAGREQVGYGILDAAALIAS